MELPVAIDPKTDRHRAETGGITEDKAVGHDVVCSMALSVSVLGEIRKTLAAWMT